MQSPREATRVLTTVSSSTNLYFLHWMENRYLIGFMQAILPAECMQLQYVFSKANFFPDLDLCITCANCKVVSLFDPRHRGDVVIWMFHLHELNYFPGIIVPQVHCFIQSHSQEVEGAPVNEVQIFKTRCTASLHLASVPYLILTPQLRGRGHRQVRKIKIYSYLQHGRKASHSKQLHGRTSRSSWEYRFIYMLRSVYDRIPLS